MILCTKLRTAKATFLYWKLLFLVSIFKQLLLKNCEMDFVEICNVCTRKAIIKAAKFEVGHFSVVIEKSFLSRRVQTSF